jgi:hypothetical protein
MTPFELAFPGFVDACAELQADLLPFAVILLVVGTIFGIADTRGEPSELIKVYVRVFLILILLFHCGDLINQGQEFVKTWVERHVPARPENVAERYKERLRDAQQLGDRADESFFSKVLNGDWYESILLAVLTLISWLAMAVLAFVYSLQRALLLGCWALSPLLLPCLAIRPLHWIGMQHLLRILGIILWPIGLALAATFTSGLIDTMVGDTSFAHATFGEAIGKGLTGLLSIGVIALWIILSTIAAPVFIQRLITGVAGPATAVSHGGELLAGALSTGTATASQKAWAAGSSFARSTSTGTTDFPAPASPPDPFANSNVSPPPPSAPRPSDPTGDQATAAILKSQEPPQV